MGEVEGKEVTVSPSDLVKLDAEVWFSTYGVIKDKTGKLIQPAPNILQKRMFEYYRECQAKKAPCKMVVLKPRQKGASTCSQALVYHHFCKYGGLSGSLMGDIQGTSDKVYEIYRRFAESDEFPWYGTGQGSVDPDRNLADGIHLRNDSRYGKETAGSKNAGRSGTVQVGNMTETAFWVNSGHTDPALAYLQSLYDESEVSLCICDSTPNGPSGWFYNTCIAAMEEKNDWKFIFAAWFEFDDSVIPFASDEERDEFVASMDDDERSEVDKYGCTPEQMRWRRRTLRDKCDGDADKFRQEYPSDPLECFLKSSRPRFNATALSALAVREGRKGNVTFADPDNRTAQHIPDPRGNTIIWQEPRFGMSYLVGVDTCTGEDQQVNGISADPDFHSVQVWRQGYFDDEGVWHKHMLVALHHSRIDVAYLSEEVAALAKYYGGALIVPEVNNSGLAVVKYLLDFGCTVYQRRRVSDVSQQMERFYGWNTDRNTRKTVIDHLAKEILDENLDIPSEAVVRELQTFVVNKKGKPEAAAGFHDDHVLAAAISVFNISSASSMRKPKRKAINPMRVKNDPTYLCPDGWSRNARRVNTIV